MREGFLKRKNRIGNNKFQIKGWIMNEINSKIGYFMMMIMRWVLYILIVFVWWK